MGVRKMVRGNRHNIINPDIAVRLFRFWCYRRGIVPDFASVDDLLQFGYALLEDGYTSEEVDRCKYVIFNHL